MNNDDRLSSGLNIDMCIEQIESKKNDDIIMQQIYISLCAYKIEIEKLKNESKEISKQHIATLDKLIEKQTKIENVIEYIKENGYIDLNGYDLLEILGGDE